MNGRINKRAENLDGTKQLTHKGIKMKNNITPLTEENLILFASLDKETNTKYVPALRRWLAKKKMIMPCFAAYGYDSKGNLFLKEALVNNTVWIEVSEIDDTVGLL
tara:strand:+ start:246 stop:563 length:318 start_codon:yes stop_codon:yes gene_type:complete